MRTRYRRPHVARAIRWSALVVPLAALLSCASEPTPADTAGYSAPRLVQVAQAATDRGDYAVAMTYYEQIKERFPTDKEHVLWANYEIAFLHHKMGDDAEAIRLFDELIASYGDNPDPTLPPGPKILAEKVKANLEASAKDKTQDKTPAETPAPASPASTPG